MALADVEVQLVTTGDRPHDRHFKRCVAAASAKIAQHIGVFSQLLTEDLTVNAYTVSRTRY